MYKKSNFKIVANGFLEIIMKKILFFVIFLLFGVLSAQEVQNEPAAEQNEPVAAEEVKEEVEAAPAEVPAAENQESEAQNTLKEEEKTPETAEKPAEPELPKETKKETPAPAETVKEEPAKPETENVPACEPVVQEEKSSKVFYQPSVGLGLGASIFSMRVNNDIDFLLKHTKDGTNVYMGLEVDFRYSPYLDDHAVYEIPIQINMMFDFPLRHHNIKRLDLWFSAGIDLAFGYLYYYHYDDYYDDKDRDKRFKLLSAWGFGVTMIFKNDVTLKLGFDSFYGKYPDLLCVAGYRF